MAAGPFKIKLILRPRNGGSPVILRASASDVANAFVTFDDLNALAQLTVPSGTGGYIIDDVVVSGGTSAVGGTDTTSLQIRKGTQDTTLIGLDAQFANLTTDKETRCQGWRGQGLMENATYFIKQIA